MGQKQGDTASEDATVAHGPFRRSARYHSETTFSSTGDTAADEMKKRDRYPSLEGTKKPTAVKTAVKGDVVTSGTTSTWNR